MYMRIHKERSSVSSTSTHKNSNSSSDSHPFSVQRKSTKNSSPEEEPRTYSRKAADLLIANVMRSIEARQQIDGSDEISSKTGVQTKLTVGTPGDKYEQEADQMAQRVMSMEAPANSHPIQREMVPEDQEEQVQTKPLAAFITPLVQREEAPQEEKEQVQTKLLGSTIQREEAPQEEEEQVQTKLLGSTIQREEAPQEEEEQVQTKRPSQAENGSFDASPSIESQLNSSKNGGSPLPDDVRAFMEPRFGFDFSQVRVHTDSNALQMNRELGAQAFTHGSDIYFGAGKFPAISDLTAHELTHVVQQTGAVQTKLTKNTPEISLTAMTEKVQLKCTACQQEDEQLLHDGGMARGRSSEEPDIQLQGVSQASGTNVQIPECNPNRPLNWTDFQGTPQVGSFAAETFIKFIPKTVQGVTLFQAQFLSSLSWVQPGYANPTNSLLNGCAKDIQQCQQFFKKLPKNQTGSYGYDGKPDTKCPSGIVPGNVKVSSQAECKTDLAAECNRARVADSARLLKHEQLHFEIACTLAKRANEKIKNGANVQATKKELESEYKTLNKTYDKETNHGCKPELQKAWEAGLY